MDVLGENQACIYIFRTSHLHIFGLRVLKLSHPRRFVHREYQDARGMDHDLVPPDCETLYHYAILKRSGTQSLSLTSARACDDRDCISGPSGIV